MRYGQRSFLLVVLTNEPRKAGEHRREIVHVFEEAGTSGSIEYRFERKKMSELREQVNLEL